jgi:DNA polymerase I-like protein with 3'-5' exonuclease and polymerase domains
VREFFGYVMPLFHSVMKMGLRGCRVDLQFRDRLQEILSYLIRRRERQAKSALGLLPTFNLNSNPQLKRLLYEEWKLPPQRNRKTRALSVDDDAILRLAKLRGNTMSPSPSSLLSVLEVRDARKKKSTYADVRLSFDSRLRTQYSITGTETGRLNSKQDLFDQGWNSQNCPKWFRRIVLPEKGEVLIEADLKFAEALIIAWIAKDEATINAVRQGIDPYKWHASRMFLLPIEMVSEEQRGQIKPVILGCGYGLGPDHLAEMLGVPRKKGQELRGLFFQHCPSILDYQETVRDLLSKKRTLVTPFGRRRTFLGRLNEEMFRKGYAFLPQSTCADYLNRALVRMDMRLPGRLRLQIHDAVLLSTPREEVDQTIQVIVEELGVPVLINGEPLVIPVEIKIGEKNWGDLKEVGIFNAFT